MEDTQALDDQLDLLPEDIHDADDLKVGSLKVSYADGKSETHPLYTGQNFVARRSAQRHRDDDKVQAWRRDNPGAALHGIFLESASVSSPHAIIYVEARGDFCFVKDLGSKNKTLMEGSTGSVILQMGDRYAIHSGAAVKFGNIGCTIRYSARPREAPPAAEAPAHAPPSGLEATQAYDAVEATAAEEVPQYSGSQLQRARAAVAASEAAPATALQVPLCDATQVEMDARPAQVTAAMVPAQLLQTLQLGHTLSGASEGASEGQEQAQLRQTGVSMGFDDGDSVWLPQLTGGPSHQARASEQEIMSPPKEDTPVMPGARPGIPPRQSPRPHEQATLPADEPLQGGMGEPTLAEALTEVDLLRSQHDESGNLDEPAQALPGRSDRQPAYPASMESMLAVDEEEGDRPVARAQRRGMLVLDDTLPVDKQQTTEAQANVQPDQATQPGLAMTGAASQQPVGAQRADGAAGPDTLQQLGLDSPGLPDQAGDPQVADEGQDLATAGEPEQVPPAAEPGSGALRPSTQEPDQAAPAWTPLASPDGWRSKRKTRSRETSPAPKSAGPHPGSSDAAEPSGESSPVAVGVEGQVARVAEHGARRQYVQEGSGQAQDLQGGSWRVKQHLQAESEGPGPAAEQQPPLAPPPQAHAGPAAQQPDEAVEQQRDPATAPQGTPSKQQQPGLPPETQDVTSGQMFAALANVDNLAGIYPDSQAEPARQVPARVPPPALPEQGSPRDRSPGHAQTSSGPAEEVQQGAAGGLLHDTGVAAATGISQAVPPRPASNVNTAADQPGGDREGSAADLAGQAKGKGRASGRAAGAKGRPGSAGAASSIPAADTMPATEAPSAQLGKQRAEAPAAAAQPRKSEYSFPDTGPDENPPVRFERAAARATRLASASAPHQEAEQAADDMPESTAGRRTVADCGKAAGGKGAKRKAAAVQTSKSAERRAAFAVVESEGHDTAEQPGEEPKEMLVKATRERRRTANTVQAIAGDAPVSAKPKRSSKKAAAAVEAAAEQDICAEVPEQPNLVAGDTDVQEEAGLDISPKNRSSRRARGRKAPAPAGRSETGGKKQLNTDAAADTEVAQTEYKVSRTTRAAQQKVEDSQQAAAGTAGAAQQVERDIGKVPVAARKKRAEKTGSEVTDSSSKRFAGLTESQAAADTLAKVKRGRHFSAIQEDDKAPGQKQPLQSQAAPAKGARRLKRATSAQEPQEAAAEQPEEKHQLSAKRARRSARVGKPQELAAAEPEPEQVQQPAAKTGKHASRTVPPRVEVCEPDAKQQPSAKKGKRASQDGIAQDSPAQPKDAHAPVSKRAKQTRSSNAGSEASNPVQPQAAKAGKRASAKPPQPDSEPRAAPKEDAGPSATDGTHSLRPGGPSSRTDTPDRQLRAAASRPNVVLISSCIDAKLRKSMTKTIERLGGLVTASPEDFTVFVTLEPAKGQKERGFIKSLNTLSALACGAPIVSEKWVDGCGRSSTFLDARDHLLQDAAAEAKLGFNLAHAWEAAQQGLLLDSTAVYLTPGLTAAEADKGEGLRMLIARAGGFVAQTVPELDSSGTSQGLILGNERDVGKEKAWAKRSCKGTFPVIGRTEFVNALLQQRMEPASCSLFTT